jgi:hypothetical protein
MRGYSILLVAFGALAVDAMAQNSRTKNPQDEQQVRKIEAETGRFEQGNDLSILALLADDWVGVSNGHVLSKADLENGVKNNSSRHGNGPNPYGIEKKNLTVYQFGDTAVVTYVKEYRPTAETAQIREEDITDVFVRSPKGWVLQFSKFAPTTASPSKE